MAYDSNNVFAKILRGELPTNKIYEDEYCIAFPDLNPKTPVHVLVIPKGSYTDFSDFTSRATPTEIAGFFQSVGKVAKQLGLPEKGYRLVMNIGHDGGQVVPHLHVHVLGGKKLPV